MQVTDDGHFVFDTADDVLQANRLIRAVHKDGLIDTRHPIWELWIECPVATRSLTDYNRILIWTAVFLPRLMFSMICHLEHVDP